MRKEQEKLKEEKQLIINDQSLIAEEKDKLIQEIKTKEEELKQQKSAKEELVKMLKKMEEKLLTGGKNIIDHTTEQERQLQERRYKLGILISLLYRLLRFKYKYKL